jgi:type I restriction enzyme S subunit
MSFPKHCDYKDSGIAWLGKIPMHWEVGRSRRLFALRNQRAYPDDEQLTASQDHGVIPQKTFMELEGRSVVQVILNAEILKHVEPGDFVISMRSFQGGIEYASHRGCISSAYVMLIPSPHVHQRYFKYLLKSQTYVQALQSTTNLVRDGQALRYQNFTMVDLPVVPPDEQRAIASFLDVETSKIDGLVSEQRRLIELLKEKRQAVISHAVTKGLNPNASMRPFGSQWLGEVPEHWFRITVRNLIRQGILEIQDGNHGESHPKAAEFKSFGIPFLMAADMNNGGVDLENCHFIAEDRATGLRLAPAIAGDVLLSHKGNQLGGVSVIPVEIDFPYVVLTPQITYYRIKRPTLDPRFLSFVLQSYSFQHQLWFLASVQATRPYVGLTAQRDLQFAMPPMDEQEEVAEYLSGEAGRFDKLLAEAERAIELLQERRTALISAAVTGKIDVRQFTPKEALT